jgi:hypothetical protein
VPVPRLIVHSTDSQVKDVPVSSMIVALHR